MICGFIAMYQGIQSQLDANQSLTISLAGNAITFVPIYANKKDAGLQAIQKDVNEYLRATLNFTGNDAQSQAAYWSEKKSMDTSAMDTQTDAINALIENFKSDAQIDETDLQTAIGMQVPLNQYLKSLVSLIAQGLG